MIYPIELLETRQLLATPAFENAAALPSSEDVGVLPSIVDALGNGYAQYEKAMICTVEHSVEIANKALDLLGMNEVDAPSIGWVAHTAYEGAKGAAIGAVVVPIYSLGMIAVLPTVAAGVVGGGVAIVLDVVLCGDKNDWGRLISVGTFVLSTGSAFLVGVCSASGALNKALSQPGIERNWLMISSGIGALFGAGITIYDALAAERESLR